MLNRVILIGNLGADPDVRVTPGGLSVTTISLATSRRWKDRNSGERKEETEWHRVVFFNRLAEIARDYTKKGQQIYVEGRIQTRKWQDKDGTDRYTTEIIAEELHLLGSKNSNGNGGSETNYRTQESNSFAQAGGDDDELYDNIPF